MNRALRRGMVQAVPLLVVVALAVGVAREVDLREVRTLVGHVDHRDLALAIVGATVSYVALSAALVAVGRTMGVRPTATLFAVGFVSTTVNHVLSLGGVAGYSLRTLVMGRNGERPGVVLAMSLLHSYLTNVAMTVLLMAGLFAVALDPAVPRHWQVALMVAGGAAGTLATVSGVALLNARWRDPLVRLAVRVLTLLPRAWRGPGLHVLRDVDRTLLTARGSFGRTPLAALSAAGLVALDWTACVVTFACCLHAFDAATSARVVIGAFSIGIAAGFASIIPGGLGTQDGAMLAMLAVSGVNVEGALLAVLLFRIVYYVLPMLIAIPVYARLSLATRTSVADTTT